MMILESCLFLLKRGKFFIRRQLAEFELNQNDIRKVSFLGNGQYFRIFWVLIVSHAWLDHSNTWSRTCMNMACEWEKHKTDWVTCVQPVAKFQLDFANFHRCHFWTFCDALHSPRLANSQLFYFSVRISLLPHRDLAIWGTNNSFTSFILFLSCQKLPHSNSQAIAPLRGL